MDDLEKAGLSVLLGTSRKSVIGLTLDTPVTDRAVGNSCYDCICRSAGVCICAVCMI